MPTAVSPESIVFTTASLPAADRLAAWNGAFGSLNAITIPDEGMNPNVHCEYWLLGGGMVLSETRVARSRFLRDSARTRRDHIDHWVLRVLRRGRGQLRHPTFETVTGPGDLVLFSMHETWTVDWEDAEWVSLCFPRDLDLRLSSGLAALPPGLLRGTGAGLLADLLLALPARVAAAHPEELGPLASAVHGMIASCLLAGMAQSAGGHQADAATGSARERVRRAILRNIGSVQLKPADLAVAAGLSRSSLYRLFEADGGVARYIRHVRLSLANAALRDPALAHKSIGAIAEAHGFPEPSDFSRAFRAIYGTSPRSVRGTGPTTPALLPAQDAPRSVGRRPAPGRDLASRLYTAAASAS